MASRVWSDFGANIPLIRSFSLGDNWPPEYAIYPGEKIRYHFLFYYLVGALEHSGVRIDWAMNIPSILGFFLLLIFIYKLASLLFERKSIGLLSVLFFLLNGSFSFLKFFEKHPFGISTLKDIFTSNQFSTFGPWDGNLVTAFVHLNVYTNQRHLALSFAIVLAILYLLLKYQFEQQTIFQKKQTLLQRIKQRTVTAFKELKPTTHTLLMGLFAGLLVGSLFFLNHPALLVSVIFCGYLFIFHGKTRFPLFITLLVTLPFLWYFFQIAAPGGTPTWEIGYLSHKPFEWKTFIEFWFHNLGLHLIFIPIGFVIAPKKIRFLCIPLLILFIVPNLYRFSVDMINNHKFFNFFVLIGNMYSAYVVVSVERFFSRHIATIRHKVVRLSFYVPLSGVVTICIFFLTFSGFLDFMPIVNDYYLVLDDIPANKDASFIAKNTPANAVILNSTWFYHPASLAGRKIYNGYSFFTWSAGYDAYGREAIVKEIFHSDDKNHICNLLYHENISYIELNRNPENFLKPINPLWETLLPWYDNQETGVRLFKRSDICETTN